MKLFIVNVNDCLKLSQFKPFLYEHIYNKQIVLLDEIPDTSCLDHSGDQIREYKNQHSRGKEEEEYAVLIFISRDFSNQLTINDFNLYNDINVYTHLIRQFPVNFRFFTFYIDKTDHYDGSDATYRRVEAPSENCAATEECLNDYFLNIPAELPQNGNSNEYIRDMIKDLSPSTRCFFEYILSYMPEISGYANAVQQGINNYIGECKGALTASEHMGEQITRNDENESVRDRLKVIYYVKALAESQEPLDKMMLYSDFPTPDYNSIKTQIVTYMQRLSKWKISPNPISTEGSCCKWYFTLNAESTSFAKQHNTKIDTALNSLKSNIQLSTVSSTDSNIVNSIFDSLDDIIKNAKQMLQEFTAKQAPALHTESNYSDNGKETFDRSVPPSDDASAENELLKKMNNHSEVITPDYAAENRLHQKLDIIEKKINNILERLKIYRIGTFLISHTVAFLSVAVFYFFTQQSVIVKEQTFMYFLAYLAVVYGAFFFAYSIVRRKYYKRIMTLIDEAKSHVKEYLSTFVKLAEMFEKNLKLAGDYRCLKRLLDQKYSAHNEYLFELSRYNWHKTRVDEILKNLKYFDVFVAGVVADGNDFVDFTDFTHDDEHSTFYHLKISREN